MWKKGRGGGQKNLRGNRKNSFGKGKGKKEELVIRKAPLWCAMGANRKQKDLKRLGVK